MKRLLTQVKWFLRYYGLSGIVPTIVGKFLPSVRKSRWYAHRKEAAFDQRFGVQTAGLVAVADLDIDDELRRQAVEYSPTPGVGLGVVLEELDLDCEQFTFVDFGCGKGRALFMAAEFPFAGIIGVEIAQTLCEAARNNIASCNLRRLKCRQIDCVHASATALEFPKTPLVLYFFNPFGAEILSQVLERLHASWISLPREIIVIYCNPVRRVLFDESDFWREYPLRYGAPLRGWAVYRLSTPADHSSTGLGSTLKPSC